MKDENIKEVNNGKQVLPKLKEVSSNEANLAKEESRSIPSSNKSEKTVSKRKINPKDKSDNKSSIRDSIKREADKDLENRRISENEVDKEQEDVYNDNINNQDESDTITPPLPIEDEEESYNEMMDNDDEEDIEEGSDVSENNLSDDDDDDDDDGEEDGKEDSEEDIANDREEEKELGKDNDSEGIISNERNRLLPNRGDNKEEKSKEKDSDIKPKDDSGNDKSPIEDGGGVKGKVLSKVPSPIKDNKAVEMMNSVRNKSLAVSKAFAITVKTLINPFFWAGVGIFILISIILSSVSVVGKNDYNEICDTEGFGGVNISANADDFTRQSAIASWLASTPFEVNGRQPMNREQVSAIMGNLIHESAGANPKQIQGERGGAKLWETCDNDCILSWGKSGKAIGIAQWMGDRRMNLASLAKSEGKQWYDLDVQLKLLQQELNGTSEADNGYRKDVMERNGWNDTQTLEDYTYIFQRKFEGAMEARDSEAHQLRETAAKDFHSKFSGHGGASSGLSANCIGGGLINIDASNVANLAIQAAWPTRDQGNFSPTCGGNPGCGKAQAKPEYLEIRKMAVEQTGGGGVNELYASCDMFVATVVRASGLDTEYPWTNSDNQINHMRSSPDWKEVSCQDRQPGDVLWAQGHIMMYVGDVNGRDSIASASLGHRVGTISGTSCNGSKFNADERVAQGWRKVN